MGLELRDITKTLGGATVLKHVSLTSRDREFVCIVGPSGSGKTTLLRTIAGLEQPDAGDILVDGQSIVGRPPRERNVAMVFQGESLYPHLTVEQNLAFPLRMRKLPGDQVQQRVESAARQLGVDELLDRMPSTLSGGQRQRVALGRALVRRPQVFLLDEPFSHLDAHLRKQLRAEIMRLRRDWEATTLFVTHDQDEAMLLGDRVAVMDQGQIVQVATPDQIRASPSSAFVAEFMSDALTIEERS